MDSMGQTDLKEYLTEDFGDKVHKRWSLLDIYRNDVPFFDLLLKKKKIRPDAVEFFLKKKRI